MNKKKRGCPKKTSNVSMLRRKGQLTVFALLGMVLLIVVIIMVIAANIASEAKLRHRAETAVEQYMESSNIDYYVYTCMDSAVKKAVEEFSRQGGVFYEDQGGPVKRGLPGENYIPFNETINGKVEEFNVSYSIENEHYCSPVVDETPPAYPSLKTHIKELFGKYVYGKNNCRFDPFYKYSGFIGVNNFTRLCYFLSENSQSTKTITTPCDSVTVKSKTPIKELSAEYQLAKRIANKTQSCINFSVFEKAEGHNITVLNNATSNITLKKASFSASITYPFIVKLQGHEPVMIRHTFKYESQLRITQIMRFLMSLITKETQRPKFDIGKEYPKLADFDPGNMDVEIIDLNSCKTCPFQNDTMLKLTDKASKIGNNPLTFYTAIKGRMPILDYIHYTDKNEDFDIIAEENETINITPYGIDPENYPVNYTYNGWKESYDEKFDFEGLNDVKCSLNWRLKNGKGFSSKELKDCTQKISGITPHNWTNTEPYLSSKQNASYTTNLSDIGIHEVSVIVRDITGKIDWQNVRILVLDKPHVNLTLYPPYPNMPLNVVSKEDFFTLNASGSRPSIVDRGKITEYLWEAIEKSTLQTLFKKTTIPPNHFLKIPFQNSDITNISILNISKKGPHILKLTIFTDSVLVKSAGKGELPVNVTSCIPYRDSDPVFPYGKNSDPYLSNHTCCTGNISIEKSYKLLDSTNICYSKDAYGEHDRLKKYYISNLKKQVELEPYFKAEKHNPIQKEVGFPIDPKKKNDVFKLEFERHCDGIRGNICGGNSQAELITYEDCAYDSTLTEQCSGPEYVSIEYAPMHCVDYPTGTTFEKTFGTGTGVCDSERECSDKGINGYDQDDTTGYAVCEGQCDGKGGCSFATNCECQIGRCGSQCGPSFSPYNVGTLCYFKCDLQTQCKLETPSIMPCEPSAGKTYCKDTATNRCYKNVGCGVGGATGVPGDLCVGGICQPDGSCSV